MQHKEIERTVIGKNVHITGGAEPAEKPAREFSHLEQWDQLAFQLIHQELAPKGFSEIKRGPYRGTVQSNIPFLPKKTVQRCQNLSAQLVRSFRQKTQSKLKSIIKELDEWVKEDERKLKACKFWEFGKKRELKYKIRSLYGQGGSASRILQELDNIAIK